MLSRPGRMIMISVCVCLICPTVFAKKSLDQAVSELRIYFDKCSGETGYSPDNAGNLGDHELHSGEEAYAKCAYDGINKILKARSRIPEIYDRFIAKHREFTDKVKSGGMTRDERKAKLDTMIVSIRNQEEALETTSRNKAAKSSGDATAKGKADTVRQMEEIKRVQDEQRKVNRSLRSLQRF